MFSGTPYCSSKPSEIRGPQTSRIMLVDYKANFTFLKGRSDKHFLSKVLIVLARQDFGSCREGHTLKTLGWKAVLWPDLGKEVFLHFPQWLTYLAWVHKAWCNAKPPARCWWHSFEIKVAYGDLCRIIFQSNSIAWQQNYRNTHVNFHDVCEGRYKSRTVL